MTYVWKPPLPLPWCALCVEALTVEPGDYACPMCAHLAPRTQPESGLAHLWQPREETLARLHGGAA